MNGRKDIGFIGTGVMGASMARHLQEAGHRIHVHNRTREKAEPLLAAGAVWYDRPRDMSAVSEVVFTMVGYPQDVETTYFGPEGLLGKSREGTIFVDMTTSRPDLAVRIAEAARGQGCRAMDAPVSGGDVGARNAQLSIMVGGEKEDFDAILPLLKLMGSHIVHQGRAGSGQHCKMANQIAIAAGMLGVCEAMAYADGAGLDPETVLKSIGSGAAGSWSLSNLAPRMLKGDFAPGFYVKHFIKDLRIALESAQAMNLDFPGLELALRLYEKLAGSGYAEDGTQALYRLYADDKGSGSPKP